MNIFKERYPFNIDFNIIGKVLDLGGGHKPHPKATHVIDLKDNNQQRGNRPLNIKKKIEYFLDGAPYSFRIFDDNYFDFIYSAHCIEHIIELNITIKEIGRTCKRGLFTFPASDFDFMMAYSHFGHINCFREYKNTILWCKKNKWANDLASSFQDNMYEPLQHKSLMEDKYRFLWECRYYWKDRPIFTEVDQDEIYPQLKYWK